MTDAETLSNESEYICRKCNYVCSRLCDFNKHCQTIKHNTAEFRAIPNCTDKLYTCKCGKTYKHRQSLYTHTFVCV